MNPGQAKEKSEIVSQEQPEKESQEQPEEAKQQPAQAPTDGSDTAVTPRKKRRVKKERVLTEEELMPRPSYWPLALAFAVSILLLGAVTNLMILGTGTVLVIAVVIGWTLERR